MVDFEGTLIELPHYVVGHSQTAESTTLSANIPIRCVPIYGDQSGESRTIWIMHERLGLSPIYMSTATAACTQA